MDSNELNNPSLTPPAASSSTTTTTEPEKEEDNKAVRKRTKTGCQTCRTRRIKCDEGKPECNNCIKSKRQCGGYGIRSGGRSASGNTEKRPRRFMPYNDRNGNARPYKNIVPAPPRDPAVNLPTIAPLVEHLTPRSPKRKREEDHEFEVERSMSPNSQPSQPSPHPPSPFRYALTSRISISSLLTVDQAAIAAFVSQQSLNTYTPNYYRDSPLTDPILFDAFRHYVEVVAPTMSLIESSPPNPTILNHHVIPSMKACNLFTYQLPMMAVSGNWTIMEAIIAISFLHISHITRSSKQQAFLHYQLALKRLRIESVKANAARDLGLLAATLLLSWYELTTGDHLKWVRHMSGAMAVLIEFGSSRWRVTPEAAIERGDYTFDCNQYPDDPTYNTAQQSLENMRVVTDRLQVSTGRILLHELFYLYAKMDVIQALVRGAAPLLDITEWRYPLRGPTTTILGLHDALSHLMARLATFIAVDRERKQELESGRMPPPNSPYSTSSSVPSTPWSRSTSSTHSSLPEPLLPPDPKVIALQEWESLSSDFRTWKEAIQHLSKTRVEPNMPTPFGPAIIYSDIRVAAAHMLWIAAQIHLTRAHPSTPSFAPAAIGATAPQNGPLVAEIMRIQEGLWDTANFRDVATQEDGRTVGGEGRTVDHVVSALSNSAWPMLVGGVQVRDDRQRKWMKTRLCDIYELSGFATAMRVKKGLEVAWGHRVRGEPTGFDDIDSDDEHDMSLQAHEQREQAKELKSRRKLSDSSDSRFVLVKEAEGWMETAKGQSDLTYAYGVLGPGSDDEN